MKKLSLFFGILLCLMPLHAVADDAQLQQDLFSNYGGWVNLTAGYTFDTIGAEPMKSEIAISGQTLHVVWAGYKNNGKERPEGYGVWYRRSTDNGATWENARSLYQRRDVSWDGYSNMMVVEGSNVHMVVPDNRSSESSVTTNAMLVYLHSSDGGATFQKLYLDTVTESYYRFSAAVIRADGNNIVVAAQEYRNDHHVMKLYRSTDNGASFKREKLDLPESVSTLGDLQMIGDKWAVLWGVVWNWDAAVYVTTGDMTGDTPATTCISPKLGDRHYGWLKKQSGNNGDDYNFHPMMAITGNKTLHVLFHGLRAKGEEEGDPYRTLCIRSDDFGQTWGNIQKLDGTKDEHGMLVAKGQNVYAVVGASYSRWIAYSNDGGDTWKANKTMCYGSTQATNYDSPRAYTLVIDPTDPTGNTAWYMGAKWLAVQTKDGFNTLSYSTHLDSYVRNNIPSYCGSQMAPLLAIDSNGINHWLMREFVGTEIVNGSWDRPVCQLFYRKETAEPDPQNKNMVLHVKETKSAVPKNRIVIPQRESLKIDSALSVGFWLRIDSLAMSQPIVSVKPNIPGSLGDDQIGGPNNFYSPGWGIGLTYRGDAYNYETGKWDAAQANITGYIRTDKSPDGKGTSLGTWTYYENQGYQIRRPGLWHYVALTWDGRETKNNMHLYLDGMLMGSADLIGAIETEGTNPIVIGNVYGSSTLFANQDWYMDELQIWTRALSREEVFALSNHQPVSSEGCIVNYGFDGTLKDLSGHGNDALAQLNCNMEEFEGLQLPKPQMQIAKDWSKRTATFTDMTENGEALYWYFDDPFLKMGDGECGSASRHTQHNYYEPGVCHPVMVARGGNACAPVTEQVVIAGLSKVEPAKAGQAEGVRMKIYGGYSWSSGLNVRLHRKGQNDIIGEWVKREGYNDSKTTASEKLHYADFNLSKAELGQWDVIVDKDTLFGAFTVEPFQAPDVWASLSGWDKMLINRAKNFSIDYGNRGNVDAYNVPFCLFVSADAEVTLGFETILYPEQIKDEQVKATLDTMEYITFQPDFGNYGKLKAYPLLIPRVAANSRNSLTFYIKSAKDVDMYYYIGTPWGPLEYDADGNPIIVEEESGNAPRRMPQDEWDDIEAGRYRRMDNKKVDCMMKYLGWGTIDATVGSVPMLGCIYQVGLKIPIQALTDSPEDRMGNLVTNGLSAAFTCASDINPLGWGWKAVTLVNALFNTAMNVYGASGCMDGGGDGKKVKAVGSYDPNEMIGPSGFGDNHYMKPAPEMSYTVTFENKSTATAPAHEVFVYDTLDAKVYDFESFAFTSFGWADTILRVDGQNMKEFVQDVKMSAEMTVRVSGQFDAEKGVAKWSFITLDKDLQPEEDPDKGFLVPNNANHEGEGFVMYGINHKADLGSGTKIANEATIIFDANAPIKTNRYINTLDSERPESKVLSAIPDEDGKLVVTWQALDAASGIAAVDLYQSVNKDEYKLVEHYTDGATSAKLAFDKDKTYCFAVVAVDNVGWLENKDAEKLSCEATYEPEDQAIDQITNDQLPITNKVIIDGNLYILRGGKIYTAQGQEVK